MMRFHAVLTTGLAALAVLPSLARLDDGAPLDLDRELRVTARALGQLEVLEFRLAGGDRGAKAELLAATEPTILDAPARDEALVRLRREVSALHESLDTLALAPGPGGEPGVSPRAAISPDGPSAGPVVVATPGLDTGDREQLARLTGGDPRVLAPPREAREPGAPQRFEQDPGYSADALRQARLLLRVGRPAEAIPLLGRLEPTPEVRYWIARAHDDSGLWDEALRLYTALAQDDPESLHARRATVDLEFLRIKRDLLEDAPPAGEDAPR